MFKTDRPWWKRTVVWVIAIVLVVGWTLFVEWGMDRSDGAVPPGDETAGRCVPPDQDMSCQAWAKQKARQFKRGKLGDSRRGHLAKQTKRAIARWYDHHPKAKAREMREDGYRRSARSDWCSWCDFTFDAGECLVGGWQRPYLCDEANDTIDAYQRDIEHVFIGCGGAALIIYRIIGGPTSAIGAGVLSCAWQLYNDKVLEPHS